ncbi:hypothetical protein B2G71_03390 [Novosphingobium sp. PC22D]|uniref:hypothetical protein n=1 Tax=Novosphingobium sp. PC22D TaxID=1962403 RepID=UPI000BF1E33C|nr:hypothetical protein [Novosphingobium sp. PC22D]PEQ14621.1 hypothetical protein B2G71_03390 [Novosphingobium sp. PC22D]
MAHHAGFSSLSPTLLARKGAARPAMRAQIIPLDPFQRNMLCGSEDDLGWNDMGWTDPREPDAVPEPIARIVKCDVRTPGKRPANDEPLSPEALRARSPIVAKLGGPRHDAACDQHRRVAFTLRLDPDRHLALRLASTLLGESAQAIVTEALDRHLAAMPDIAMLAGTVRGRS